MVVRVHGVHVAPVQFRIARLSKLQLTYGWSEALKVGVDDLIK